MLQIANLLAIAVLFIGAPLNWYVTWRLWQLHRVNPEIRVLRERGIVATVVSLTVTLFGLIFLNNDALPPPFSIEVTKILTRFAMLMIAVVPAVYWLWLYLFDDKA